MEIYKLDIKDRKYVDRHLRIRKFTFVKFLGKVLSLIENNRFKKNTRKDFESFTTRLNRKIHIFIRHVGENPITKSKINKRPQWFDYEACFKNLLGTIHSHLENDSVTLNIFFDGNEKQFDENFIGKYKGYQGIKFHLVNSETVLDSWVVLLNYLRNFNIPQTDIIYILENDYIHQKGWVNKVLEVYELGGQFDFVSLYDHPDRYCESEYNQRLKIIHTASHHWRTAPSTCASFIMTKEIYDRSYSVLKRLQVDHRFFKRLNPSKQRLITPIPGLATHGMTEFLSPVVDWEKISKDNL